jgi:putative FmdB family regulatory protein
MPVYEYGCDAGHRFEVKQKLSEAPLTICQVCALPVTRLISPSGISFKGSGWYVTDYSNKLKPSATQDSAASTDAKKDDKKDGKKDSAVSAPSNSQPSTADSSSSPTTPPGPSSTGTTSS